MKKVIILLGCFFFLFYFLQAQVPPEISRIIKKMQSGIELTKTEEKVLENYGKQMQDKFGNNASKSTIPSGKKVIESKPKIPSTLPVLTRQSYIELAKLLMHSAGEKSGDISTLNKLLEKSGRTTDGADYGAILMMEDAGQASIYVSAWSAVKNPMDILTANNLAVALKDAGEYAKALQVLMYANAIRPGIGLILSNTGWVYYEAEEYKKAKAEFDAALTISPEMTSPYLGLGLIAKKEGSNYKAKEYLEKSLKERYSFAGMKAYQNAQESYASDEQLNEKPLSGEKDNTDNYNVPDIPIYEQPQKMASQEQIIQNYITGLDTQLEHVVKKMESLSEVIQTQQEHAIENPDNSIVYNRDFSKEIMMLDDIEQLLWGEPGNYGRAVREASAFTANTQKLMEQNSAVMFPYQEKLLLLNEKIIQLSEEALACNGNKACEEKIAEKMAPLIAEQKQINYKLCKLSKHQMDILLAGGYKSLSTLQFQLKKTVPDYYAFTNPILEKIYAPTLNEFYNLRREAKVLSEEKILSSQALGMAENASKYYELQCVEPEPPIPSDAEIEELGTLNKKPDNCPLGDGLKGGIGVFAFELTCTYVKISGGEGVLASVKRDFVKHETTIWAGVGAKAEYGHSNITGEATVGVEVTVGQNAVKDVGFTSSVKAGIGGLTETEISGRIALESGASIDVNTNFLP